MNDLGDGLEANDLPKFHCRWYDVGDNELYVMRPVPEGRVIAENIANRLEVKKRFI